MTATGTADRLHEEAEFCYRNVPLLRHKFDAAGLAPHDVRTPEDLRRLPPTTRAEYRASFPAGVLAEGATLTGRFVLRSQSSGTAGDRAVSVANTYTLAARMDACLEVNPAVAAILGRRPLRTARYAAPNCSAVECASPHTTMEDRILDDGTLVLPVAHDLFATPDAMVRRAIDEVRGYDPDYLYCDPTHLAFLLRACDGAGLPGAAVVLTYTMTTRAALRRIRQGFPAPVPVVEALSMSEFGWLGLTCPHGTTHLNDRTYLPELLTDAGTPAGPGDTAELYVTTFGDRLAPRLRYRTGDLYTVLPGCACGHPYPAVRFAGRRRDLLRLPDGATLTPRAVDDLLGDDPRVTAYRVYQPDPGRVSLAYLGPADAAGGLRDALAPALGGDVRLDVTPATYLPGQRSGKFQPCVSDVSAGREQREGTT